MLNMRTVRAQVAVAWLLLSAVCAGARAADTVVDLPTRPGVTQRVLVVSPAAAVTPKGVLILLAGGHGGLQLGPGGAIGWGQGNFLVRTRQQFADQGFVVAVVDAPSDRQRAPFLTGFRQTPEHAADIKAVIAWARKQGAPSTASPAWPVWLVGTSRGTQSAAYVGTTLAAGDGPDGLVLTSTILDDNKMLPVPALPLEQLRIPVVVVHHELDGCKLCDIAAVPGMMAKLAGTRAVLLKLKGGQSRGDPCEAFAYHGFNGIEAEVVEKIARAIAAP